MSEVPSSVTEACSRLRSVPLPDEIRRLVATLQQAGHETVLVGGTVRDVLLGRSGGDWDVASAATPEEVQALFRRTIPTGIQHGTVTVMLGPAAARRAVEVTTFRGEGRYVDGRRPSTVQFLRSLRDDLARRDFTVNAFAWDPIAEHFTDEFDGLEDLRAGSIRAVGDALERFLEDGLRVMRAVRFCATLGFRLETSTHDAVAGALHVLGKVSKERVHAELMRLLGAEQPSRGLYPMRATGIWPLVLPALSDEAFTAAAAEVDRLPPDVNLRWARLLWPLRVGGHEMLIEQALEALKPSREQRARVLALTSAAALELDPTASPAAIRRVVARLGRESLLDVAALRGFDASETSRMSEVCDGVPLKIAELPLRGGDLVAEGVAAPGPRLGRLLERLLDATLEDPTLDRARLLALARVIADSSTADDPR